MEMYYDGALVMPKKYAVVDEEEMTYVEGGIEFFNYVTSYSSGYNAYSFCDRQASRLWGVYFGGLTAGALAGALCGSVVLYVIIDVYIIFGRDI